MQLTHSPNDYWLSARATSDVRHHGRILVDTERLLARQGIDVAGLERRLLDQKQEAA